MTTKNRNKKKRSKVAVHHYRPRVPLVLMMTETREMTETILWRCLWRPAPLDILAQKTLRCTPADKRVHRENVIICAHSIAKV